jgi:cell division protein FtsB
MSRSSYSEASAYIDRLSESYGGGGGGGGDTNDDFARSIRSGSGSKLSTAALNTSDNRYSSPPRTRGLAYTRTSPSSSTNIGRSDFVRSSTNIGRSDFVRSSTSVLAAFRELQAKAKRLEMSRADTIRQCEDLKDSIAKAKRTKDLWQRQNESETMETMLSLKAQCEQLRRSRDEFHTKVKLLEEQQHQYQKTIASLKARSGGLEDDINTLNSKIRTEKFRKDTISRELSDIEVRCENLDEEVIRSPLKHRKHSNAKRDQLTNLESQLDNVKRATFKAEIKIEALRKYVELLMNINGDLCTTLTAREMTKDKILELARKYAPPRYTWPKHFEYVDMVRLLTDAAMTAAKDGALARATAATIAAVGLSPYKGTAPLRTSLASSTSSRPSSAPVSGRRVTAYNNSLVSADPASAAAKLLMGTSLDALNASRRPKKKKVKKLSSSTDSMLPSGTRVTRADGIESQLARTAAAIASLSMPTINPDVENIPSYRLALSARGLVDPAHVSPTAVREVGPPIHGDREGVFVPSGQTPTRNDGGHNELAKKSQVHRSMSQSVAQFHSA